MESFFIGLGITAVGVVIAVKTEAIYNFFGAMEFFERYLGTSGGSRLGYKLIGFLFIFIGVLVMTGLIGSFMEWLLWPILRFSQPSGTM